MVTQKISMEITADTVLTEKDLLAIQEAVMSVNDYWMLNVYKED